MRSSHVTTARRGAVLVTAVGLLGVLTACGGSDPTPDRSVPSAVGSATTPTSTASAAPTSGAPTSGAPTSGAPVAGSSGGLSEVPTLPVTTAPPVPLASPATVGGVTVSLGAVSAFTGTAQVPGELGGPAVAVPVTLRNGTGAAIDAGNVVVDLVAADGSPASPLSSGPAQPLTGSVAPGASATGVYAFTLAEDARAGVSVAVSYRTGVPVALFTGSLP